MKILIYKKFKLMDKYHVIYFTLFFNFFKLCLIDNPACHYLVEKLSEQHILTIQDYFDTPNINKFLANLELKDKSILTVFENEIKNIQNEYETKFSNNFRN